MNRRHLIRSAAVGLMTRQALAGGGFANGPSHAGIEVAADLDRRLRIRNERGTDGGGLCVWASLSMSARYHNCRPLFDLFERMKAEVGGGWPSRVDEKMRRYAPHVRYEQYLGGSLEFIRKHVRKGRMVCATYGYGEFYGGATIAHMICVVGLTDQWAAILDNNDPEKIWWMPTAEYHKRFVHPTGQGWAVALHLPPPPPAPHN